jgi:hypothetical protein
MLYDVIIAVHDAIITVVDVLEASSSSSKSKDCCS